MQLTKSFPNFHKVIQQEIMENVLYSKLAWEGHILRTWTEEQDAGPGLKELPAISSCVDDAKFLPCFLHRFIVRILMSIVDVKTNFNVKY